MVSLLVPVYNYPIADLLSALVRQFQAQEYPWEILFYDDASTCFVAQNQQAVQAYQKKNIQYFKQQENCGNAEARNRLIEKARYPFLLCLDADVVPVSQDFVKKYIAAFQRYPDKILSGGICYADERYAPEVSLRWLYGKQKEEVSCEQRQKNPIPNVRAANFGLAKASLNKRKFQAMQQKYGFVDISFFAQFQSEAIVSIPADVFHNGLETNAVFLAKTQKSIKNAAYLLRTKSPQARFIRLLQIYQKCRRFRWLMYGLYACLSRPLQAQLRTKRPRLFFFQLYKFLYLAKVDCTFEEKIS